MKYWCKAHKRIATHKTITGYQCDPSLGGIMMPCDVQPVSEDLVMADSEPSHYDQVDEMASNYSMECAKLMDEEIAAFFDHTHPGWTEEIADQYQLVAKAPHRALVTETQKVLINNFPVMKWEIKHKPYIVFRNIDDPMTETHVIRYWEDSNAK